eukprot:900798-Prorocentrum_minimum.AAC.1
MAARARKKERRPSTPGQKNPHRQAGAPPGQRGPVSADVAGQFSWGRDDASVSGSVVGGGSEVGGSGSEVGGSDLGGFGGTPWQQARVPQPVRNAHYRSPIREQGRPPLHPLYTPSTPHGALLLGILDVHNVGN